MWRRPPDPLVDRDDVTAILTVLFDIKREVVEIRRLLLEEDDGETEADS
jgi:hypothetical protein